MDTWIHVSNTLLRCIYVYEKVSVCNCDVFHVKWTVLVKCDIYKRGLS